VTFTVVREGDTLRASCGDPAAPWALAAGERVVRAAAGTGFVSLELGESATEPGDRASASGA
jgi:alpha-D-xyloside xylohydrolase